MRKTGSSKLGRGWQDRDPRRWGMRKTGSSRRGTGSLMMGTREDPPPEEGHVNGTGDPVSTKGSQYDTAPIRNSLTMAAFFTLYLHPVISTCMFKLFQCDAIRNQSLDTQYWLRADPALECFTGTWFLFMAGALAVLLMYTVGIPGAVAYGMRVAQSYVRIRVPGLDDLVYVHDTDLRIKTGTVSMSSIGRNAYTMTLPGPSGSEPEELTVEMVLNPDDGRALTLMDCDEIQLVREMFTPPVKPEYDYWILVELLRRLSQTSVAVFVELLIPNGGLVYAGYLSVMALCLHTYVCPYRETRDNFVQIIILLNHALLLQSMIGEEFIFSSTTSYVIGSIILIGQLVLIVYMLKRVITNMAVAFQVLFAQGSKAAVPSEEDKGTNRWNAGSLSSPSLRSDSLRNVVSRTNPLASD
ncbi:hypothetical protein CYMTET_43628 [Cymbomonas tetramitiformis]|uniref:Uncharacterized protein n=1 Tax=Cymbomonas tetramitiformis TaxID=36881 RepID=A0AAE0F038_9CHLO|nr:hypothetical protein CYMTET_43628 [Cymbomonas tetramitiformis]